MRYAENFINIKQRGRGSIILRKYMRKYGIIGASYTDDLCRRLEALHVYTCRIIHIHVRSVLV